MKMKSLFIISAFILFGCDACISNYNKQDSAALKIKTAAEKQIRTQSEPSKIRIYGPEKVSGTFGIPIEKIMAPPIPWTKEELDEEARKGRVLILRICPKGYPNTVEEMIKKSPNEIIWRPDNILEHEMKISACALRKGWIISDVFPYEWTNYGTYGEQLTEAIKNNSYSKILAEALYDALLLRDEYKNMERYMGKKSIIARLADTYNNMDLAMGLVKEEKEITFVFMPMHPFLRSDDLQMITQTFENGPI